MNAPLDRSGLVYQMQITCNCEGGRPGTVYTDEAGAAQVRQNQSLCPTCWGYYTVVAIHLATPEEVAANPLR